MTVFQNTVEPPAALTDEDLSGIYREMVRARRVSERMVNLQRQGRVATFAPIDGQEAAVIGSMWALDRSVDWIVPAYREPRVLKLFPAERMLPVATAIAVQIPHATGLGWGLRLRGQPGVVLTYFGDGAMSEGDFYEGCNLAGVVKAPVVFFCINNGWAISTARAKQTAATSLAAKAEAFGFPGVQVDGNDALAVFEATAAARRRAACGAGPTLIEAVTYRLTGHTTADDPTRYVPPSELAEWRLREPIGVLRTTLTARGIYRPELEDEANAAAAADIDLVLAQAQAASSSPDSFFRTTYRNPPRRLVKQHQQFNALHMQPPQGPEA